MSKTITNKIKINNEHRLIHCDVHVVVKNEQKSQFNKKHFKIIVCFEHATHDLQILKNKCDFCGSNTGPPDF